MPWTGSSPNKTYVRTDNTRNGTAVCTQAKNNGINDTSELTDNRENDFAEALNLTLTRDGSTQASANLPMNTYRHTGVGAATARTDYARASQVQDSSLIYGGTAGGTANAITLDLDPSITSYEAGLMILFKASADNTDDDVTVNVDGVGNATLFKFDGATKPAVGDIQNGGMYLILHDGTNFQLIGAISPNVLALAALTGAADKLAYFSGAAAMALADFTDAGRAVVGGADAAAQRTSLGLGTMALETAADYLTKSDNLNSVADKPTAFGNIKQAASDSASGVLEIAVQSEMEAASSTLLAVTPGRQHFHSGSAKAWINLEQVGTISDRASYNVSSIVDEGTGLTTINWGTDFSSADYAVAAWAKSGDAGDGDGSFVTQAVANNKAAGSILIKVMDVSGGTRDSGDVGIVAFGDFA